MVQEVQQAAAGMARAAMLSQYQREADADEVDLELILALLRHLCEGPDGGLGATSKGTHGAVLVFLPGRPCQTCSEALYSLEVGMQQCMVGLLHTCIVCSSTASRTAYQAPEGADRWWLSSLCLLLRPAPG